MADLTTPSNFRSAKPWSAHWHARGNDGVLRTCATQGLTFAKLVQRVVKNGLSAGVHQAWGTVPVSASDVAVDGAMGPKSIAAAGAYLEQVGGPADFAAALRSEYETQEPKWHTSPGDELGWVAMAALKWIALESPTAPSSSIPDEPDAVGLRWSQASPADGANGGRIACWNPLTESVPAARTAPSTLPATTPSSTPSVPATVGPGGAAIQSGGGWSSWSTGTQVGVVAAGLAATAGVVALIAMARKKRRKK